MRIYISMQEGYKATCNKGYVPFHFSILPDGESCVFLHRNVRAVNSDGTKESGLVSLVETSQGCILKSLEELKKEKGID